MTIHTICDTCGMEYDWAGVTVGQLVYCCIGCAKGGPCTCPVRTGETVVVSNDAVVVAGDDDVVIVK